MSVKKYRSVEEMPGPRVGPPLDPDNLRKAIELSALAAWFHPVHRDPGVHKFRSFEEACRSREKRAAGLLRRSGSPSAR